MKNHTSCYYFPLFICTRLVLSFEYDNICSVLISTSLMITKIMNVSVDCKKKKIIHCSVLLEKHVSQSIEFCHCANSFCLEIGISRFFFFDYQLIFFFSHSKKKTYHESYVWEYNGVFRSTRCRHCGNSSRQFP